HADHIGAVIPLCGTELPLYIHKEDELALTDPAGWGAGFPGPPIGRPGEVRPVSDGDVLDLAGITLEVLHTPGHTPGSVCFRADAFVFTGDRVFRGPTARSACPHS